MTENNDKVIRIVRGTYGNYERPVIYFLNQNSEDPTQYFYEVVSSDMFEGQVAEVAILERIERFQEMGYEIKFEGFVEFSECPECGEEKLEEQKRRCFCFSCSYEEWKKNV